MIFLTGVLARYNRFDDAIAVQNELLEHAPAAWIYHARGVQGVARRLRNVEMDLRGELATVARWTLEPAP